MPSTDHVSGVVDHASESRELLGDLYLPTDDVSSPEVSVVIPACDEQITIGETIDWCKEGFANAGVVGEVLIVDSSSDQTAAIALEHGARVLSVPKRGLGRAYIDAIPYIRADFVLMGDADCTYDFRELSPFVEKLREGYDFVMGSRWLGSISPGAMPPLHRYFGTPFTTRILNVLYGSRFTDIHCGMRAISKDALKEMALNSQSWEYASEMIIKAVRLDLRTTEVPVVFHKDRDGRVSHYKRQGRFTAFHAGWISWRIQFVYRADFFMKIPGLILWVVGMIAVLPLAIGPIAIGRLNLNLLWMLLGLTTAVLGMESYYFGCLAEALCDASGKEYDRLMRRFTWSRTVPMSALISLSGAGIVLTFVAFFFADGLKLPALPLDHLAVIGLLLIIIGFSTFCFTLLLNAIGVHRAAPTTELS